jgi:ribosomal-protein-alanine N-acetyltransferase
MEKLEIREEGIARGLVEINGVWEDHIRFGITVEEWLERRAALSDAWL